MDIKIITLFLFISLLTCMKPMGNDEKTIINVIALEDNLDGFLYFNEKIMANEIILSISFKYKVKNEEDGLAKLYLENNNVNIEALFHDRKDNQAFSYLVDKNSSNLEVINKANSNNDPLAISLHLTGLIFTRETIVNFTPKQFTEHNIDLISPLKVGLHRMIIKIFLPSRKIVIEEDKLYGFD